MDTEPDNWGVLFDPALTIEAALNWYVSGSPNPPTLAEMLDRDPLWDNDVRLIRKLLQFQLDAFEAD